MDWGFLNTREVSKMTPDQAARIIQKAWFEYTSWHMAQNAEYTDTPDVWIPNDYYFDEDIECIYF